MTMPLESKDTMTAFRAFMVGRRAELGMSQADLATASGVKESTIASIEVGAVTRAPRIDTIEGLSRGLKVPYEKLDRIIRGMDWVFVEPSLRDLRPEVREMALELERMTAAQLRLARAMIRTIKEEAP